MEGKKIRKYLQKPQVDFKNPHSIQHVHEGCFRKEQEKYAHGLDKMKRKKCARQRQQGMIQAEKASGPKAQQTEDTTSQTPKDLIKV